MDPPILTTTEIANRVSVSKQLYHRLQTFLRDSFMSVVTCDESWFYLNSYNDEAYVKAGEKIQMP